MVTKKRDSKRPKFRGKNNIQKGSLITDDVINLTRDQAIFRNFWIEV